MSIELDLRRSSYRFSLGELLDLSDPLNMVTGESVTMSEVTFMSHLSTCFCESEYEEPLDMYSRLNESIGYMSGAPKIVQDYYYKVAMFTTRGYGSESNWIIGPKATHFVGEILYGSCGYFSFEKSGNITNLTDNWHNCTVEFDHQPARTLWNYWEDKNRELLSEYDRQKRWEDSVAKCPGQICAIVYPIRQAQFCEIPLSRAETIIRLYDHLKNLGREIATFCTRNRKIKFFPTAAIKAAYNSYVERFQNDTQKLVQTYRRTAAPNILVDLDKVIEVWEALVIYPRGVLFDWLDVRKRELLHFRNIVDRITLDSARPRISVWLLYRDNCLDIENLVKSELKPQIYGGIFYDDNIGLFKALLTYNPYHEFEIVMHTEESYFQAVQKSMPTGTDTELYWLNKGEYTPLLSDWKMNRDELRVEDVGWNYVILAQTNNMPFRICQFRVRNVNTQKVVIFQTLEPGYTTVKLGPFERGSFKVFCHDLLNDNIWYPYSTETTFNISLGDHAWLPFRKDPNIKKILQK